MNSKKSSKKRDGPPKYSCMIGQSSGNWDSLDKSEVDLDLTAIYKATKRKPKTPC